MLIVLCSKKRKERRFSDFGYPFIVGGARSTQQPLDADNTEKSWEPSPKRTSPTMEAEAAAGGGVAAGAAEVALPTLVTSTAAAAATPAPVTSTSTSTTLSASASSPFKKHCSGPPRIQNISISFPFVYGSIAFWQGKNAEDHQTHRWTLYVRGPRGEDLSYAISKGKKKKK
jgi:hypothetical protein